MLPKLTKASTGYFVAQLAIVSPWALSYDMYLSPINKCGVNLSGGQSYLKGLHATYFDIKIETFRLDGFAPFPPVTRRSLVTGI
jgi:hypothetical protein